MVSSQAFSCSTPSWQVPAPQEAAAGCKFSRSAWARGVARESWALGQAFWLDLMLSWWGARYVKQFLFQALLLVSPFRWGALQEEDQGQFAVPLQLLCSLSHRSGRGNVLLIQRDFISQQFRVSLSTQTRNWVCCYFHISAMKKKASPNVFTTLCVKFVFCEIILSDGMLTLDIRKFYFPVWLLVMYFFRSWGFRIAAAEK